MSVIINLQEETEIFCNENGSITISQIDHLSGEKVLVVLQAVYVNAVCKALRECRKEIQGE